MNAFERPDMDASSFRLRVYQIVEAIPVGRVTTYGAIARALGQPRAARIVGGALSRVPAHLDLPCHRVVNRVGYLSGGWSFGHPDVMKTHLLEEAVPFRDEWHVDLESCFWDPSADFDSASSDEVDDFYHIA
jgi:methylated-DNA-protein-cysteine methyltransferase related protein